LHKAHNSEAIWTDSSPPLMHVTLCVLRMVVLYWLLLTSHDIWMQSSSWWLLYDRSELQHAFYG